MIRIGVGIPAYMSKVSAGHMMQAGQLAWAWAKAGLPAPLFLTVDSAGVDKARNLLVAKATLQAIYQMIADGDKAGAAVIGAPVKMRNRPGYNVSRGDKYELVAEEEWRKKVVDVDRIGSAFTAINMRWMAANWPLSPWFKFDHIEGPNPESVGEDYYFCAQVKARGGAILADGRFEPIHVGASNEVGMVNELGISTFEA